MSCLSMLINGQAVAAEKGAIFERRNPLDGSVATRAPTASEADAIAAVEAAALAFKTWSQTGPGERRALLLKAADALQAKRWVASSAAATSASMLCSPLANACSTFRRRSWRPRWWAAATPRARRARCR